MRIAVVDDESIFRMQLKMMVEKVAENNALPLIVEEFGTGPDFIKALSDKRYDIVFMDIFMPDMDGIATAKKLRELTERTFLIFMTASDGHYPDAFSLHAFDYVTKPFTIERIENVIDEIIAHTPLDEYFLKVNVGGIEERIFLRDIVSVTTDAHYLEINKQDGFTSRVRLTSGEFLNSTADDKRFIMINRGIIINMDFIEKIDGGDVYLKDKTIFPISAKKVSEIKQKIENYRFSTS